MDGNPNIRRLFTNIKSTEKQYFRDAELFPIMHAVAIRKDVAEENPSLPADVFRMYSEAKNIAYDNLRTTTVLRTTLPWASDEYEETTQLMGKDYWRYGFSWICATASLSDRHSLCLIITAPITKRASLLGRPRSRDSP